MILRRLRKADPAVRTFGAAVLALWTIAPLAALQNQPPPAQPPQTAPAAQPAPPQLPVGQSSDLDLEVFGDFRSGLAQAAVRLPIAALFGTALALRPRRAGSPPRDPAVIETQIVLAVVGALIMLVVGASLARAFGIAGAANLIRYRAKIEDPKDAVVMLSALAVGLASGVGLFGVALVGTIFLVGTLFVIESFETHVRTFLLTVKLGEQTPKRRKDVERLLRKAGTVFELRTTAEDELSYLVSAGESLKTESLSAALSALATDGKAVIEWKEEKKARPLAEKEEEE